MSGADATSVATCVVKAVSSADGTSARPTHVARSRQSGAVPGASQPRRCTPLATPSPARRTIQKQNAERRKQQHEADRSRAWPAP